MLALFVFGALVNGIIGWAVDQPRVRDDANVYVAWKSLPRISDPSKACIFLDETNTFYLEECQENFGVRLNSFELPFGDQDTARSWVSFWMNFSYIQENILSIAKEEGLTDQQALAYASRYQEFCTKLIQFGGTLPQLTLNVMKFVLKDLESYACLPTDTKCKLSVLNSEKRRELAIPIIVQELFKVLPN